MADNCHTSNTAQFSDMTREN